MGQPAQYAARIDVVMRADDLLRSRRLMEAVIDLLLGCAPPVRVVVSVCHTGGETAQHPQGAHVLPSHVDIIRRIG